MYFSRNKAGELGIWLSWVDDSLTVGLLFVMKDEGEKLAKEIEMEDVNKHELHVGCKIEFDKWERSAKFTQPVMIQSFFDEFGTENKKQATM